MRDTIKITATIKMVERYNRTLKQMLCSFVNKNHDDWDEQLS
jgi:hypothetical protein